MPEANSLIHSKQPAQLAEFPAGVIFFLVAKPFTKAVNSKPRGSPCLSRILCPREDIKCRLRRKKSLSHKSRL